jgi:hypothetical protein
VADLVIKINGDVKNYKTALAEAEKSTEALESSLSQISKISAIAFAGLTGEILLSTKAFGESQAASNKLTQALQNQGIYSADLTEEYKKRAAALQELTGIDDDSIVAAQASLQAMIGQAKITDELTQSIVDLSAAKGIDLDTTAELIGKGIQGQTGSLQKLGIVIDEHLDKEERTARIIELVTQKFGGQAAAANQGLGAIRGLKSAFGDFQEEIGSRFAPLIEAAIQSTTRFIAAIAANKPLVDFIAAAVAGGAAVAALGTVVGIAGTSFLALKSILTAVGATMTVTRAAAIALGGATGIGLIAFAAAELALNWSTIWPKMQAVFQAFVGNVSNLSNGLGAILGGVFSFDIAKVKQGMADVKSAIQNGYKEAVAGLKAVDISVAGSKKDSGQEAEKAKLAKEAADKEVELETIKNQLIQAQRDQTLQKLGEFSAAAIALKQNEIQTLTALQTQSNQAIKEALYAHLDEIRRAEQEANAESLAQSEDFKNQILATDRAYQQLDSSQRALFDSQNNDKLRQSLETEKSIRLNYAQQQLQADINRRNQYLLDETKFGANYAAINRDMNSVVVQNTRDNATQLVALSNSKNSELKAIGKAAAVTQIGIDTAKGAMAVYANFQTAIPFPPVSIPLGLAASAAIIAYGAERTSQVLGAADGGMVTGGIPGRDSVPAMLMPGELITPARSYEEVVSAVANQRAAANGSNNSGGISEIVLTLKDDLIDFIEAKLVERQRLNISIVGA